MTQTSGAGAGWHPDPTGQFEQRYWDGAQWTEHVFSGGVQSVSSMGAPPAVQHAAETAPEPEPTPQPEPTPEPEPTPQPEPTFAVEPAAIFQPVPSFQTAPAEEPALQLQPDPAAQTYQPEAQRAESAAGYAAEVQPDPAAQQYQQAAQQPSAGGPPAGWHPDPSGQFEQRYWDGSQWTEHVAHQGQQGVSPIGAPRPVQTSNPQQVQQQVQHQAGIGTSQGGGGHLMDEPVLVVNQKAKIIEITQEFAVYDQAGNQLGSVVQVGQSSLRKVLRFVSNVDQYLTHKFEVRDQQGAVLMTLVRPAKFMKSKVIVSTPTGQEIGVIRQENVMGKIRFAFEVNGQRIGGIQAENWRAWNFSIIDANEQEIARITKTWEGMVKAAFTTADNYVIQIHHRLPEPLRSLVVASALTVDTALKQDSK